MATDTMLRTSRPGGMRSSIHFSDPSLSSLATLSLCFRTSSDQSSGTFPPGHSAFPTVSRMNRKRLFSSLVPPSSMSSITLESMRTVTSWPGAFLNQDGETP